eukprot:CAMPEP_0176320924 /NCGR_PEP_ID=MMETSP0121_2-20121125/71074_1 /TAXON_ID=160619 /ORGANISM="Kryptoperidinium foliaceum, Strain CCMP 1326" /LENGTH=78 /DNA_ID=CAMNT_0017663331 /DNA_START=264 /DNA_END=500 /DNA_ORIENTATION=+
MTMSIAAMEKPALDALPLPARKNSFPNKLVLLYDLDHHDHSTGTWSASTIHICKRTHKSKAMKEEDLVKAPTQAEAKN